MACPPAEGGADGSDGPDRFDHDLRDLLDQQRRHDAAAGRRRQHWLARQADESGTLAGVLLDLGEQEQLVTLTTGPGYRHTGAVRTLGADFVGLRTTAGQEVLVALAALATVRPEPGAAPTSGDRVVALDARLADVLGPLAGDHARVVLHTTAGEAVAGTLRSVGRDVVGLAPTTDRMVTYVAMAAVTAVLLP